MTENALIPPTSPGPLPATAPLGPVPAPERIAALDVLRGVAIFGIFMVNMQFFAMPMMELFTPPLGDDAATGDVVSWAVVKTLFEYKFISIFSMMFGMGMVVQMKRAEAKGRPFAPVYLRRLLVLMLIGLAHALLLWYGDILFAYSLAGLLVFVVMLFRPRTWVLLLLAAATILLSLSIIGCFSAVGAITGSKRPGVATHAKTTAVEPEAEPEAGPEAEGPFVVEKTSDDQWERVKAAFERVKKKDMDGWREIETIAYKEGPLSLTLIVRAVTFGIIMTFMTLGGFMFRVIGMFLLGAALMQLDFFSPRRRRWHWWMCAVGLPLGVAGELFAVSLLGTAGKIVTWGVAMSDPLHQVSSLVLCLGYVGAVTVVVNGGVLKWCTAMFAAVGRLALSNYLLQTFISTTLMYWWGLAWFADVSRPRQIALVLAIYACQILGSVLWLRVFSIGPFEWLWRSLTYLRPQPLLR
ncbi:MAG: DUF418 domain-containing protein [Planctomycetota bacterium]|jgi:uncharacterized protein